MDNKLDIPHVKKVISVCLLTATSTISAEQIASAFNSKIETIIIEQLILELGTEYKLIGLELLKLNDGYRIRSQTEFQKYLNRLYKVKPPKYSRAIIEVITIIAYKQPITRGEIEEIRGVTTNGSVIQTLLDRQWIKAIGVREVPGRPELLATTDKFLEDLSISSLCELPILPEVSIDKIDTNMVFI